MRAFTILATLACAAITSARPFVDANHAVDVGDVSSTFHNVGNVVSTPRIANGANIGNVANGAYIANGNNIANDVGDVDVDVLSKTRRHNVETIPEHECDCTTVPNIIKDLTEQLKPLLDELSSLTKETYTLEIVKELLGKVKDILHGAIEAVNALVNKPVDTLLVTVSGVLSIVDLCGLIGTLLKLIFGAVHVVLTVVVEADKEIVRGLLAEVLSLVGTLLQAITGLLASTGILAILIPICSPFLQVISSLGVTKAFSFLGKF